MTLCYWPAARRSQKRRWPLATFRELSRQWPRLRLVFVPRHPDRFEAVAKLLDSSGLPWQRRTAFDGGRGRKAASGSLSPLPSPLSSLPSRPACRRCRRTRCLVGGRPNRVRRRKHGQPRRAKHDRAGRLRRRRLLRPEHLELPRHRRRDARPRCRSRCHDGDNLPASSAAAWKSPTTPPHSARRAQSFVRSQLGATSRTLELLSGLTQRENPTAST